MDKNFINIDDLVRQRLGGGEENERSGAWMQMRELLDKEMPQKRAGFVYWRRMLGAMAVLLLIATISIGGYRYNASRSAGNDNMTNNNDATANNTTTPENTTPENTTPENNAETNNPKQITAVAVASTRQAGRQNAEKTAIKQENKQILATTTNKTENKGTKNKKHEIAKNKQFLASLIAANERRKQLEAGNNRNVTENNIQADNAQTTSDASTKSALAKNSSSNSVTMPVPAVTSTNDKTQNKRASAAAIAADNALANKYNDVTASATSPATHRQGKNNRTAAANDATLNTKQLALGSSAASSKKVPGNGALKSGNGTITGATNTDKKTADNEKGNGTLPKTAKAPLPTDMSIITRDVAATKMGKKVIDRLVLSEHFVKTAPNEGYYKLDTISMGPVNDELGVSNEADAKNSKRTASANGVENTDAEAPANAPILPGSTTSATGKSGMGLKEAQAAKAGSGKSTIEKLTATFNDIKFHVAGAQFSPGLTGGINGTFFGPNSFKGFQFGVTGNFAFGDNVSILAELKYFHRINNNYALNDDYYTYTPVGGGQYSKELQPVSYSFSTLHSIELPVSIRYCMSHFNFFVGGNFVYAFAINTGASTVTPVNVNAPVLVSAPGNDNAPKIKEDDFNSRFGLGYLMGVSYQVSPNLMLDFRNVQTVWNNGNSQGAKIISNQLYKSPSLQISIGYRLGNKQKNKD